MGVAQDGPAEPTKSLQSVALVPVCAGSVQLEEPELIEEEGGKYMVIISREVSFKVWTPRVLVRLVEEVITVLFSSHDHIKVTTKL